jgi:hypothetical protein
MQKRNTEGVALIQSDLSLWFCNYLSSKEQNPIRTSHRVIKVCSVIQASLTKQGMYLFRSSK